MITVFSSKSSCRDGFIQAGWGNTMFMYDATFAFQSYCIFQHTFHPIGPLIIASHCTLCEGASSNRCCVGPHTQSEFIKSDQTRGNSPVSWLPPHSNHFLPCHSSLSWLNSAPFVIVLRTSSSLRRLSVYRLSLLVDTKAGKQGEKQHRCLMKRRVCRAQQTYSVAVCSGTCSCSRTNIQCVCVCVCVCVCCVPVPYN